MWFDESFLYDPLGKNTEITIDAFLGLQNEYENLKKDVPNLEFYDCKDFLEMAKIIKSCKFYLGNVSFGWHIAEALKVPRLLEGSPEDVLYYPHGDKSYVFFFQEHFEKLEKME